MRWLVSLSLLCLAAMAAEPPKLKLGDGIRPVKYAADLTLVPGATTFSGKIDIEVALSRPAALVWLNATDLTLGKAAVTYGGRTETATVEPGDNDFVGLKLPTEIP